MPTETIAPAAAPAVEAPKVNRPGYYDEAFAGLDELEKPSKQAEKPAKETPKPTAAPKPPAEKQEPAEGAPKPPAEKPVTDKPAAAPAKTDKKPETAEPEPAPEADPSAKFQLAHDLRKAFRNQHKELQAKENELKELRAKVSTKAPPPEPIIEENKALKKRLEEVETELKYVDYTKSAEFKEKFEKPYQDAYDDAIEEVKEFHVLTEDGGTRPATAQDFQRVLQADVSEVRKIAADLFGESANDVLVMRRKLVDLNRTATREAKRYRESAGQREQERAAKIAEEREGMRKLWTEAVESIPKKYPEWFAHKEGDDEWNAELDAGYAVVDKAHQEGLPVEEKVARLAALRHRAAAFRPLVMKTKRLEARVAELTEVIKGYEESSPKAGKNGSEANRVNGSSEPPSAFDELDAIDAKSSVHA